MEDNNNNNSTDNDPATPPPVDDSYDFEAMILAALEAEKQKMATPSTSPQISTAKSPQPQTKAGSSSSSSSASYSSMSSASVSLTPSTSTTPTAPTPAVTPAAGSSAGGETEAELGFDPSILEQPVAQRLQNRNFKVKVHAAKCVAQRVKEGEFPPEKAELEGLVKMTSDSAPLSQEAGLTTLEAIFTKALVDPSTERAKIEAFLGMKEALKVDVLATSLIEKCLASPRQKIREQGLTVLLFLIQMDEQETVTVFIIPPYFLVLISLSHWYFFP